MRIRKDVIELSIPVLTEQVFLVLMGVVNTMMAGNIGKEAVSAIGMVDSINNIFIAFFTSAAV
ncbi:MAG: MATE family efflux transporter, partial [Clostridiales bacterium]|nr:MATE family efflux transporter [Clostridiales bacterium]